MWKSILFVVYRSVRQITRERKIMKLKLTTPNGFKSEFNISPYFIISIGILVIQLHQAGLI
ncbi:hypothetical protein S2E19_01711 [Bacillus mycoides]|nr:hypothetical protein S2E19_01711 [Bacillus mycoides]